jgi:hypothetical protein
MIGATTAERSDMPPISCASGLVDAGLTACCGNGPIRALNGRVEVPLRFPMAGKQLQASILLAVGAPLSAFPSSGCMPGRERHETSL